MHLKHALIIGIILVLGGCTAVEPGEAHAKQQPQLDEWTAHKIDPGYNDFTRFLVLEHKGYHCIAAIIGGKNTGGLVCRIKKTKRGKIFFEKMSP